MLLNQKGEPLLVAGAASNDADNPQVVLKFGAGSASISLRRAPIARAAAAQPCCGHCAGWPQGAALVQTRCRHVATTLELYSGSTPTHRACAGGSGRERVWAGGGGARAGCQQPGCAVHGSTGRTALVARGGPAAAVPRAC